MIGSWTHLGLPVSGDDPARLPARIIEVLLEINLSRDNRKNHKNANQSEEHLLLFYYKMNRTTLGVTKQLSAQVVSINSRNEAIRNTLCVGCVACGCDAWLRHARTKNRGNRHAGRPVKMKAYYRTNIGRQIQLEMKRQSNTRSHTESSSSCRDR
jgi:hypothetical protein